MKVVILAGGYGTRISEEKWKVSNFNSIQPGGKFGALDIDVKNEIKAFAEKSKED